MLVAVPLQNHVLVGTGNCPQDTIAGITIPQSQLVIYIQE